MDISEDIGAGRKARRIRTSGSTHSGVVEAAVTQASALVEFPSSQGLSLTQFPRRRFAIPRRVAAVVWVPAREFRLSPQTTGSDHGKEDLPRDRCDRDLDQLVRDRSQREIATSLGVDRERIRKSPGATRIEPGGAAKTTAQWSGAVSGWFPELAAPGFGGGLHVAQQLVALLPRRRGRRPSGPCPGYPRSSRKRRREHLTAPPTGLGCRTANLADG